jgi:hypothetical protein
MDLAAKPSSVDLRALPPARANAALPSVQRRAVADPSGAGPSAGSDVS